MNGYAMNDFSRISSSPLAQLNISTALYGNGKDDSAEKTNNLEKTASAKNSFMGRLTKRVLSAPAFKISQAIRQMFYSSIGHLLKPGTLSKIFENAQGLFRNDKPLPSRNVSVPPESLGSWHELETMQSKLSQLKSELNSTHEQNNRNFQISTSDISDTKSLAALKQGYPKEAELKTQVQEQEKKVADFEKRLSQQKHVPAFPIKPRPPEKPVSAETITQQKAIQNSYAIQSHVDAGLSARDKARLQGSPVPGAATSSLNTPDGSHAATKAALAEKPLEAEPAAPKVTAKVINTNFDPGAYAAKASPPNVFRKNR